MIIYKITNKLNGKSYIGYDTSPMSERKRWKTHQKEVKNRKNTTIFYNAFRSYGVENFKYKVIDNTAKSFKELVELEVYYIRKINTIHPNGYNMNEGGYGGDNFKHMPKKRLDEVKKAMSEKHKEKIENDPFYLDKLKEQGRKIKEKSIKHFNDMSKEDWIEYRELLSRRTKETWSNLSEDERQKRIDDSHTWLKEMGEEEKILHYEKVGAEISKWRNSMTAEEKKEFNRKTGRGVKKNWDNLSEHELIKRGKIRSRNVKKHWDNLSIEERKTRNRNSGRRNTYSVISPKGEIFEIKSLPKFCRKNNLDYGSMWKISKSGNLHKGWRCEIVSNYNLQ